MTTIKQALDSAASQLTTCSDSASLDADILLGYVLGRSRAYLRSFADVELTAEQLSQFNELVSKRAQNMPIAYILGEKEFWSLNLKVTTDTLIPRPETEIVVETVLSLAPHNKAIRIADLGTGSGAIALALASQRPNWQLFATDISNSALNVARDNAQRLGIDNVSFHHGNWFTALPLQKLDIVVSNPPYVSEREWEQSATELQFEPKSALIAGNQGMDDICDIVASANQFIQPEGYLLVEHGYMQGELVREVFTNASFVNVRTICDLAGLERITLGQVKSR